MGYTGHILHLDTESLPPQLMFPYHSCSTCSHLCLSVCIQLNEVKAASTLPFTPKPVLKHSNSQFPNAIA